MAPVHHIDHVKVPQDPQVLSTHDPRLLAQNPKKHVFHDSGPDFEVQGGQGRVYNVDVRIRIHRPSDPHPLFLPSTQGYPVLSYLGKVASWQRVYHYPQLTVFQSHFVALFVVLHPENDIRPEGIL